MITVIDRWLESAVALSGAAWINPYAAYSLLSCKRWALVGGILEQSPCGWHWPKEGWGKKQTEEEPSLYLYHVLCVVYLTDPIIISLYSKPSQCLSAASSRFVSCVLVEVVFGPHVDLIQSSGCLTGSLDGRYRKWIFPLWPLKHWVPIQFFFPQIRNLICKLNYLLWLESILSKCVLSHGMRL